MVLLSQKVVDELEYKKWTTTTAAVAVAAEQKIEKCCEREIKKSFPIR